MLALDGQFFAALSQTVLAEGEALVFRDSSHLTTELIRSREGQQSARVLIFGDQPSMYKTLLLYRLYPKSRGTAFNAL